MSEEPKTKGKKDKSQAKPDQDTKDRTPPSPASVHPENPTHALNPEDQALLDDKSTLDAVGHEAAANPEDQALLDDKSTLDAGAHEAAANPEGQLLMDNSLDVREQVRHDGAGNVMQVLEKQYQLLFQEHHALKSRYNELEDIVKNLSQQLRKGSQQAAKIEQQQELVQQLRQQIEQQQEYTKQLRQQFAEQQQTLSQQSDKNNEKIAQQQHELTSLLRKELDERLGTYTEADWNLWQQRVIQIQATLHREFGKLSQYFRTQAAAEEENRQQLNHRFAQIEQQMQQTQSTLREEEAEQEHLKKTSVSKVSHWLIISFILAWLLYISVIYPYFFE